MNATINDLDWDFLTWIENGKADELWQQAQGFNSTERQALHRFLDEGIKQFVTIHLAQRAITNLVALAQSQGVSLSELLERLGRTLSKEKLEKILLVSNVSNPN